MSARVEALRGAVAATATRRRLVLVSILLGTGSVIAAVGLLTTSGYLISRAAQRPEILSLTLAIVGVRFFGTIRALLRYGERLASHELAFRSLADLRVTFFRRLAPLVPAGLPGIGRADLLRRFVGDVDRLQDLYLRALAPPAIALASGVVAVLVAALILPEAGLVLAVMMLLGGLVAPLLTRLSARSAGRRQAGARAALARDLLEIVEGAAELKVAGRGEHWLQRCRRSDAELRRIQRRDALSGGLAAGLSTGLAVAAAVAVTAAAIPAVEDGRLGGVMLAALALLALGSFEAITPLGTAAAEIDACADAALRIQAITTAEPPVEYPRPAPGDPEPKPAAGPVTVSLESLSFGYGSLPPLFSGLAAELEPGTVTALVGASGSGKSTLAELLVRFRDPRAGRIALNGRDIRKLSEAELRATIRLAPQDSHLFTATLRENLLIGRRDADDAALHETLGRVGLGPWLAELPEGLDTFLGEAGARVSGGQRQRIAAARVLLSAAPVQIYDEPTAHLDPEGGAELVRTLSDSARAAGHTVLLITHEPDRRAGLDQIIDLERFRP